MDPESVRDVEHVHHGGAADADVLDFSANVNPRTPDGVADVYRDALDDARRYPVDDYPAFRDAAADAVGCEAAQVVPTAGGLGAIRLAVATAVEPGDAAVLPAPSFGEYAREVRLQGGEPLFVPHDEVADVDPRERVEGAAEGPLDTATAGDVSLVVACTPNNPTGDALDPAALCDLAARCREAGATLLVDEAFLGFAERASVAGAPGAVVARSLTKLYGLPGLRAGYAVATGERLEALRTAREPWTLGAPAAAVGAHCLRDRGFVRETRERTRSERERLRDVLAARFEVAPSEAPFLLLDVGADTAGAHDETSGDAVDALLERARERGVALRDARTFRGLDDHVRVAVRTPAENDRLLAALGIEG